MRKKNRQISLAIVLALSGAMTAFSAPVLAAQEESHPARLVDDAGLLEASQAQELEEKLDQIIEEYACDVAIITEESIGGMDIQDYADDFFDDYDYGMGEEHSGILLLVTMSEREWWMTTTGDAIDIFTDARQEEISDHFVSYLSDEEYYDGFVEFADLCENTIVQVQTEDEDDLLGTVIIAVGIGFVLSLIITGVMRSGMKSVRFKPDAADYLQKGSVRLNRSHDMFLYRQVTKSAKPKNNSSSSSTHVSSSGRTHGGSGGSF